MIIIFGLWDTPLEEVLKLTSKMIVGALYLFAFFEVFRRIKFKMICIYLVALALYSLNLLIFSHDGLSQISNVINIFFFSLPSFVYTLSLKDVSVFKSILVKASVINFIIGAALSILMLINAVSLNDNYSMSLSYYMLLPSIIFVDRFIEDLKLKHLSLFILSISIIILIGARGPLICIAVFYILKLIKNRKTQSNYFFHSLVIIIGSTILVNMNHISLLLYNKFLSYGIYSRTLYLLSRGGVYLSGRESIFETALNTIYENPIVGVGFFGDRSIMGGIYVHNIILEILLNFGVIFGGIIIIILSFTIIHKLIVRKHQEYNILVIWISLGLVSFLYSGSYLTDYSFWIFMGVLFNNQLKDQIHYK